MFCIFSIFCGKVADLKCNTRWQYLKFGNIKLSSNIFIFWNPICLYIHEGAFYWRLAFWYSAVTCFSKLSLISISLPNSFRELSESILWLSIRSLKEFFSFPSLLIITDWNLSGITIISLERKQSFSGWLFQIIFGFQS